MEIGTAERLTAAASYDLLRRLTEKGLFQKKGSQSSVLYLMTVKYAFQPERIMALFWKLR